MTNTRTHNVLLIDDDAVDARLTKRMLDQQAQKIDVTQVDNGHEALQYLQRIGHYEKAARPDLVLLDLRMPRMDGREFLSTVRSEQQLADIPVIVLSVSDSQYDIDQCYRLRANSYIVKSSDLREYDKAIRACADFWLSTARLPDQSRSRWDQNASQALPLSECVVCGVSLPRLRLASTEMALKWKCRRCDAVYEGELEDRDSTEFRENMRPARYFTGHEIVPATTGILDFVSNLVERDREDERRGAARRALMIKVPAIRLDRFFYPCGAPFSMISRNISASGISLLHEGKIDGFLALEINLPSGKVVELVMETVRCVRMGRYFEIAGRFVERL